MSRILGVLGVIAAIGLLMLLEIIEEPDLTPTEILLELAEPTLEPPQNRHTNPSEGMIGRYGRVWVSRMSGPASSSMSYSTQH